MAVVGGGSIDRGHLEIERVFLLRGVPQIPAPAQRLRILQGYLPGANRDMQADGFAEGRLRSTTLPDGSTRFHHTIKRGAGMIREEVEREISGAEFEQHWPRTLPVRINKTRHEIQVGDLLWQVDVFDSPAGLVLAEVEIAAPDARIVIPDWINRELLREVTDDPAYTNRAIAMRLAGKHEW